MEQDYTKIAKTMRAFSDPKRLLILDILSCGERCAGELQEALSMTQPTTSYHMKLLADTGVVAMRSEGKYVFYSLDHQRLLDFMQSFDWLTTPKPDCVCQAIFSGPCREVQNGGELVSKNADQDSSRTIKPKVAFICVHNSCRSQIAEALGKKLAADTFESYSAGTELKDHINPDAVRLIKTLYNIDMEQEGQHSKLLADLPAVDGVVTMGCNVVCPNLPCLWREDWGLDDPSGQPDEVFLRTIQLIEEKIIQLKEKLR